MSSKFWLGWAVILDSVGNFVNLVQICYHIFTTSRSHYTAHQHAESLKHTSRVFSHLDEPSRGIWLNFRLSNLILIFQFFGKPFKAIESIHNHRLAAGSINRTHLPNLTPKFLNDPGLGHSEINYLGLQPESPAQILKPPYHPGLQVSVYGQNDVSNDFIFIVTIVQLQNNLFGFSLLR